MKLKHFFTFGALILIGALMMFFGDLIGYKRGQIDYAQHKIVYTVVDEHLIKVLGKAPAPEIKLTPIPEEKK